MARVAPFCHKCHWDGRGAVGRATNEWPMIGVTGMPYLRLCEVCSVLAHMDAGFRVECLVKAVEKSMEARNK